MGVNDFNEIVKRQPVVKTNYKNIIYDFSNLVVIALFSNYTRLRDEFGVSKLTIGDFKAVLANGAEYVLLDVGDQAQLLVQWSVERMRETIVAHFKEIPTLEMVYLITDPPTDYDYTFPVNKKSKINAIDLDLYNAWFDLNKITPDESGVIHFNSKREERIKRSKYMSVPMLRITTESANAANDENDESELLATSDYSEIEERMKLEDIDDELEKLFRTIKQSLFFVDKHHLLKLIPLIQRELLNVIESEKLNVRFLESSGEADPCIKAFYEAELYTQPTLVISADTDYWFLFGEVEDVDVATPTKPGQPLLARNPFNYWSKLFKSSSPMFLRLCIARASALLGNDYTQHLRIVGIDRFEEVIPKLFNIEDQSFTEIQPSRARNLSRITRTMSSQSIEVPQWRRGLRPDEIIKRTFKPIDSSILAQLSDPKCEKLKAREFFNGYYETLLIYANYDLYEDYTDLSISPHDVTELKRALNRFERFIADFETGEITFQGQINEEAVDNSVDNSTVEQLSE